MTTSSITIAEKSVQLSHGTTHYFETGSGQPIIMLHGSGLEQGGADFLPSMPFLNREFRVLAPNFVGWAPGGSLPEIASFPYLIDFVREFQDALGLSSSHIVGVSMGAWIAALLAYESPDRVDSLVVTGNPGLDGASNSHLANWQAPDVDTVRQWVNRVTEGFEVGRGTYLADKLKVLNEEDFLNSFRVIMRHMGADENRKRYAMRRRLPHLSVPTLFLFGNRDSNVKQAEEWHNLTSGSTVKIIGGGHRLHIEEPELFGEAVLEFCTNSGKGKQAC